MSSISPSPCSSRSASIFELPRKKWKTRKSSTSTTDSALSTEAMERIEEENRKWVRTYLVNFLQQCAWNDQLEQISINWEYVPSMQELESYGRLSESEGTRACRKLFKAAVIWDDLGHALWKTLQAAEAEQQQHNATDTASPAQAPVDFTSPTHFKIPSFSLSPSYQAEEQYTFSSFDSRDYTIPTTSDDNIAPHTTVESRPSRCRSNSRTFAMTRSFTQSCASAVKRAFGEKSENHVTKRAIR